MKQKEAVGGNFNLFHQCFTNEIKGGSIHYTCKMEGGGRTGACPWWDGVGGEGALPPSLENEKRKANIDQLVRWGINRRNIFVL